MADKRKYRLVGMTRKQEAVMCFLWDYYERNDRLPTAQAVCDQFGFKFPNAGYEYFPALERRGYLQRCPDAPLHFMFTQKARNERVECPVTGTGFIQQPASC